MLVKMGKKLRAFMVRYILLRKILTTNGFRVHIFFLMGLASSLSIFVPPINAVSYGSDSACTRPSRVYFPSVDTTNTLLGFASFESGFFLEDYLTSCTHNDFYPITGYVGITGGELQLQQDLTFSNTLNLLTVGGTIWGNNHAIKLLKSTGNTVIPSIDTPLGSFDIRQLTPRALTAVVNSVDWNYSGQYVIAATNNNGTTANELQLYYFDGLTLTTTTMEASGNRAKNLFCVRWHPALNYFALGSASGTANELDIYYKDATGPLRLKSGLSAIITFYAVAWHPSGNYLVAGAGTSPQVRSYSFNKVTGALNTTPVSTLAAATVSRNALSFAPGGNYLACGVSTANFLRIFTYSGTGVLANHTSVTPGRTVQCVDWCPTGTYVAAGLTAGTESLRIYAHTISPAAITEVTSLRVGEAKLVNGVHWDPTGNLLAIACTAGTGYEFRVFYFDKVNLQLIEYYRSNGVTVTQFNARWSRDGNFIVRGDGATPFNVTVHGITRPPLTLRDTNLVLCSDTTLKIPLAIIGSCKINSRGKRLLFQDNAEIVVRPGGSLVIEDCALQNVGKSNIRCLTDDGSITLRSAKLALTNDYTFSRGALLFDRDVVITGTNSFIYTSGMVSRVASGASLIISPNTTFQYAPNVARRDLLQFADQTSVLYLDGCSLYCTRTGLQLAVGTAVFDDLVTLSSGALYAAEGMSLASNLTVNVLGNANVAMYGFIRAD
jgi:WD40 repeat protein